MAPSERGVGRNSAPPHSPHDDGHEVTRRAKETPCPQSSVFAEDVVHRHLEELEEAVHLCLGTAEEAVGVLRMLEGA